jgi:hypothetical protein
VEGSGAIATRNPMNASSLPGPRLPRCDAAVLKGSRPVSPPHKPRVLARESSTLLGDLDGHAPVQRASRFIRTLNQGL